MLAHLSLLRPLIFFQTYSEDTANIFNVSPYMGKKYQRNFLFGSEYVIACPILFDTSRFIICSHNIKYNFTYLLYLLVDSHFDLGRKIINEKDSSYY